MTRWVGLAGAVWTVLVLSSPHTATAHPLTAHGQLLHLAPQPRMHAHQSGNWFGYNQGTLEQGHKLFTSIGASWTVPTATQHSKGQAEYSSDWIGIGGGCIDTGCLLGDPTLIQTGTEQDVSSSGRAAYSAWWEIIPGPSLTISSMKIGPRDRMHASISELLPGSNVWTITLRDLTRRERYSTLVPYASTHDTAEWIEETPLLLSTNAGFAGLPHLTATRFDGATINGQPAHLGPSQEIQLTDSKGRVIGSPSAPDPDADGFTVCAWARTCAAPGGS